MFLVLIWYKINKLNYYLDAIVPFQTNIVVNIDNAIFRYSILVLIKTDISNILQTRYDILVYCTALIGPLSERQ